MSEIKVHSQGDMTIKSIELKTQNCSVTILDFGATIQSFKIFTKDDHTYDVVLGYDNPLDYITDESNPYFGAFVGRTCNRTKGGRFMLNSKSYQLPINNGPNSLHGGIKGYSRVFWNIEDVTENEVEPSCECTFLDKDQTEGYPGALNVKVRYTLKDTTLSITSTAELVDDTPSTIVNLTSHPYFNLSNCKTSATSHSYNMEKITSVLELDSTQIPTGKLLTRSTNPELFLDNEQLLPKLNLVQEFRGYDHYYLVESGNDFMNVYCNESKLELVVSTSNFGFQFYTGNWVDVKKAKVVHECAAYGQYSGFCIEPSQPPDAINSTAFKDSVKVSKGKPWSHNISYKVTIKS